MAAFEPLEPAPEIAVGVSGGPDSLALTLLLDRWVRSLGGHVVGLTVDHGLRPESAIEARQVGAWLAQRGIAHRTLTWMARKPGSGLQAAARDARYALLDGECGERGILHLAVGHHADDQAETALFRHERRSGPAGRAGMPAERSLGRARLIRPVLGWPKAALVATCAQFGQPTFDDPSNQAERFARTGLRRRLTQDSDERAGWLEAAAGAATGRTDLARSVTALLAEIMEIRPEGFVLLDRKALSGREPELRRSCIATSLRLVGGGVYPPAPDAVGRIDLALHADSFRGGALAGCMVRLWDDRVLVCREPARVAAGYVLDGSGWQRWDRRFLLRVAAGTAGTDPLTVGALGAEDFARLRRHAPRMPQVAGISIPCIRIEDEPVAVPAFGWRNGGVPEIEQRFAPPWPLSQERFTVVYAGLGIMFGEVEKAG